MSDPRNCLGSIWYCSKPSEVRYPTKDKLVEHFSVIARYSEAALGIWLAADFQKSRRTSHTEKVCKLSCKKIPDKITLSAQQGWC